MTWAELLEELAGEARFAIDRREPPATLEDMANDLALIVDTLRHYAERRTVEL